MPVRRLITLTLTITLAAAGAVLAGCGSLIVTQRSAEDLRDRRGFEWATHESDAFVIHAEADAAPIVELPAIADAADESKRAVLATLELGAYEPRISVFLVGDRDRMEDLIGRRTNATAYHASNAVCIVWKRSGTEGLRHEMAHVIAMNEWGIPERWVNEGLAVDATGPWTGRDLDEVCRALRERGELPSLRDLTTGFERLPSAVSYPAVGSFVRFLRETHGIETVRAVWAGGRRSLPESTGRTVEELERDWLARVDRAPVGGAGYDPGALTPRD